MYTEGLSSFLELLKERPLFTSKSPIFSTLSLALPTMALAGVRCVLSSILHEMIYKLLLKIRSDKKMEAKQHLFGVVDIDRLCAGVASSFVTDMCTYPLETMLVRANIQGFPVLLDDVEGSSAPFLLSTNYRGWRDMFLTIRTMEGRWGFFKGFSAMLLHYFFEGMILFGLHRWSTQNVT